MTQYFDLIIRCPACIKDNVDPGPATSWYHTECNGGLQIGDDATYRCKQCSYTEHVKEWRYKCKQHRAEFRSTSSAHLASAISTAGQITSVAGRQWLMSFLDNLGDW